MSVQSERNDKFELLLFVGALEGEPDQAAVEILVSLMGWCEEEDRPRFGELLDRAAGLYLDELAAEEEAKALRTLDTKKS